jgi:glycosyltransferase 2 family protein
MNARARSLLLKSILGVAVTAGLFVVLFRYVDLAQLRALAAITRWELIVLGFGIWTVLYLGRALRFVLLAPRTPYSTMLVIASIHNLLVRLLPFRTGELSYAFLVRRAGTAGIGESLFGLLLVRILDSTMVVVLFAVSLAFQNVAFFGDRRTGLVAAIGAAVLGLVVVVLLAPLLRLGLRLCRGLAGLLRLAEKPRVAQLLGKLDEAVTSFARIPPRNVVGIGLLSLGLWLLTFAAFFAIMRAFSMPVGLAQTVLGSTAAVVTGFLPIGGIGSFGTLEAGWALGFVLVGLDRTNAVASAFGVSIATFAYVVVLGLAGWLGMSRWLPRSQES